MLKSELIEKIAQGLIDYQESIQNHNSLDYPAILELGLNELTLTYLKLGKEYPQGIPDFLTRWCQKPMGKWNIDNNFPKDWTSEQLIEEGKVSDFCIDIATREELGKFQQEICFAIRTKAKIAKQPEFYTEFRRFLIENPVITAINLDSERRLYSVKDTLKSCYEKVPESYQKDGNYYCCGNCGGLMYLNSENDLKCENKHCQKQGKKPVIFQAEDDEAVYWLKKELRYFFHRPGKPEIRLEKKLKDLNLDVILYPEYDQYDLHLKFPNGKIWAIDVKFWEIASQSKNRIKSPIKPLKNEPYQRCFFVFPDDIKEFGKQYKQEFIHSCSAVKLKQNQVYFEGEFLKEVKKELQKMEQKS